MTPFVPRPAPLQRRVFAGLFDAAFILVLSGITFAVPLALRGLVLPMWGVLAVLLGYAVVPIAFFKRTLGMQVLGLEVVGRQGHALTSPTRSSASCSCAAGSPRRTSSPSSPGSSRRSSTSEAPRRPRCSPA